MTDHFITMLSVRMELRYRLGRGVFAGRAGYKLALSAPVIYLKRWVA